MTPSELEQDRFDSNLIIDTEPDVGKWAQDDETGTLYSEKPISKN